MFSMHWKRWTAAALLVIVTAAAGAPVAEAGSHKYRKGKHKYRAARYERHDGRSQGRRGPYRARYEHKRSGSSNDLIAGLIIGTAVGATLARGSQPVYAAPPPDQYYYDPYCRDRFSSLDSYRSHCGRHDHPKIVRVIEIESGDCSGSYRWDDGRWNSYRGDGRDDWQSARWEGDRWDRGSGGCDD